MSAMNRNVSFRGMFEVYDTMWELLHKIAGVLFWGPPMNYPIVLGPSSVPLDFGNLQSVRRGRVYLYLYCSGRATSTGTGTRARAHASRLARG